MMIVRGRKIISRLWKKRPIVFILIAVSTFILVSLQYHSSAKSSTNDLTSASSGSLRRFLSFGNYHDDSFPNQSNTRVHFSAHQIEPQISERSTETRRPHAVLKSSSRSTRYHEKQIHTTQNYDNVPQECSCSSKMPRILLITYFRSGSSFLGDLLQQSCQTFYSFEPLHFMTQSVRIPDTRSEEAFSLLGHILRCSFPEISHYVRWALRPDNRFLFKWNRLLWSRCSMRPVSCFNAAVIKHVCNDAELQLVKATRLHMRQVRPFLQTLDQSIRRSLKVVFLVRDPRGIYNSRKNLLWCANKTCADPETICSEMSEDLIEFRKLKSQMPEQFFMLRYEDLSVSPETTTMTLFQELELPFSKQVQRFLRSHTRVDPHSLGSEEENPYSTRRNSISTAVEWVNRLTSNEIQMMQTACHSVITDLQYLFISRNRSSTIDSLQVAKEIATNLNFAMALKSIPSHNERS